jgi:DNA processing protein
MDDPAGITRISNGHPGYPELLSGIIEPPQYLYTRGSIRKKDVLAVAVVGSRKATRYGLHMSRTLSRDLAAAGVTIVSGLARGIDTEAHRAALHAGGRTLAVMGCGLDVDYPRSTGELKNRILENGALISEFEHGTPPLPRNFPSRNRIISGLSLGVIVVEAGRRSGSLITARWALDQGREVMAVPGRADSPLSEGPITLIREGAAPVCSAEDVIRVLNIDLPLASGNEQSPSHPITDALRSGPRLPEEISRSTGIAIPKVLSELSRLMIEGLVTADESGAFSLK